MKIPDHRHVLTPQKRRNDWISLVFAATVVFWIVFYAVIQWGNSV